jgi:hypothetical protein
MLRWLALCLCLSGTASAFDILGCSYHPPGNPDDFIRCVNNASDKKARDANDSLSKAFDEERKKLKQELPSGSAEVETLAAVRKLNLQPLFACLDGSGASPRLRDDVAKMASDPSAAMKLLFDRNWQMIEQSFDALIGDDLDKLTKLSNPTDLSKTAADATKKLALLTAKDPVLKCLAQYTQSRASGLEQTGKDIEAKVRERTTQLFEQKLKPIIQKATSKGIDLFLQKVLAQLAPPPGRANVGTGTSTRTSALDSADSGNSGNSGSNRPGSGGTGGSPLWSLLKVDPEAIASAAYIRGVLLPRVDGISAKLAAVNVELAKPTRDPVALDRAAKALRAAVAANPEVTAVVEIQIAIGIIKALGNNYIEYDGLIFGVPGGGVIWDMGYGLFTFGINTGYDVLHGTAGVIPEVAAYIFSVVRRILQATEEEPGGQLVKKAVKMAMLKGFELAWGSLVENVGDAYINYHGDALNRRKATLKYGDPMLSFLVDRLEPEVLKKIGAHYLDKLIASTESYNQNVQMLVNTVSPPQ